MWKRSQAVAAATVALCVLAGAGAFVAGGGIGPARAQSVSVLSEADVELRKIGRLKGTSIVYVEFPDGARCVATDNGGGDVDCDW